MLKIYILELSAYKWWGSQGLKGITKGEVVNEEEAKDSVWGLSNTNPEGKVELPMQEEGKG